MRRFNYKKYLLFGLLVFLTVSLPVTFVQSFRTYLSQMVSPLWRNLGKSSKKNEALEKLHRLEIENHLLRVELGKLFNEIEKKTTLDSLEKEITKESLRKKELLNLLKAETDSVVARVIYREAATWGSTFWINVGEETNKKLGISIIKKNSPVLFGRSVVGAIDYVGKKQSKVRLITDSALKPSVRAARGKPQNIYLQETVENLVRHLKTRTDLAKGNNHLIQELEKFKATLSTDEGSWYLAKGIVQGSKTPFCRNLRLLWGVGFNYDFEDREGPSRDIVSGKPTNQKGEAIPLLMEGDLLITTGMDGIFPPGLRVGEIFKIHALREGAFTYEIEAVPSVGNLEDLTTVFVIAPIGFDHDEKEERSFPSNNLKG